MKEKYQDPQELFCDCCGERFEKEKPPKTWKERIEERTGFDAGDVVRCLAATILMSLIFVLVGSALLFGPPNS
jgi:hypothetical protein